MVPSFSEGVADSGGIEPSPMDIRSLADAALIQRITGPPPDGAAETELCRRFAPRIRLYGLKHLRDEDHARDLVQAVLLAVLQRLRVGPIDHPERIDRFILGTCRNLALRARRADGRAEPTDADTLALVPAPVSHAPDPADFRVVRRCMKGLDLRTRTVLYLSFGREKSAREIARVLDTTPGNVRVLRHRAVAHLRNCVDGAVKEGAS